MPPSKTKDNIAPKSKPYARTRVVSLPTKPTSNVSLSVPASLDDLPLQSDHSILLHRAFDVTGGTIEKLSGAEREFILNEGVLVGQSLEAWFANETRERYRATTPEPAAYRPITIHSISSSPSTPYSTLSPFSNAESAPTPGESFLSDRASTPGEDSGYLKATRSQLIPDEHPLANVHEEEVIKHNKAVHEAQTAKFNLPVAPKEDSQPCLIPHRRHFSSPTLEYVLRRSRQQEQTPIQGPIQVWTSPSTSAPVRIQPLETTRSRPTRIDIPEQRFYNATNVVLPFSAATSMPNPSVTGYVTGSPSTLPGEFDYCPWRLIREDAYCCSESQAIHNFGNTSLRIGTWNRLRHNPLTDLLETCCHLDLCDATFVWTILSPIGIAYRMIIPFKNVVTIQRSDVIIRFRLSYSPFFQMGRSPTVSILDLPKSFFVNTNRDFTAGNIASFTSDHDLVFPDLLLAAQAYQALRELSTVYAPLLRAPLGISQPYVSPTNMLYQPNQPNTRQATPRPASGLATEEYYDVLTGSYGYALHSASRYPDFT